VVMVGQGVVWSPSRVATQLTTHIPHCKRARTLLVRYTIFANRFYKKTQKIPTSEREQIVPPHEAAANREESTRTLTGRRKRTEVPRRAGDEVQGASTNTKNQPES
jgi:hypothetical protein